jgi:hypothetical protein
MHTKVHAVAGAAGTAVGADVITHGYLWCADGAGCRLVLLELTQFVRSRAYARSTASLP